VQHPGPRPPTCDEVEVLEEEHAGVRFPAQRPAAVESWRMVEVELDSEDGTFVAALDADGIVLIWLDGGWVGEGRWTGTEIDIWSQVLAEPVRAELSRPLAAES